MIHQPSRCTDQNVDFAGSPLKTRVGKVERASSKVFHNVGVHFCLFADDLRLFLHKGMLSSYCSNLTERKKVSKRYLTGVDGNSYLKACTFTENFKDFSHLSDKIACRQYNQSAQSGYNSRTNRLREIQVYLLLKQI